MRRGLTLAVAVLALLGVLAPPSFAQAPAPKVTMNGLLDTVTVWGANVYDSNYAARKDSAWSSRNRGVFTFTGEVGKAKAVLALELDLGWGQVSGNESVSSNSNTISSSVSGIGSPQPAFRQGQFDLGTDVTSVIELKNMYLEFPVPLIPFPTVMRLGGMPFQATWKPSVLATTDYGGLWMSTTITPNVKFNLTYAQAEEDEVGMRANVNFFRGDDFFIMPSLDITPFKGLDLRPFYGYYSIYGNSNFFSRCRVQCAGVPGNGTGATLNQFTGVTGATTTGNYKQNSHEDRHYFGIDARLTSGPFYFDPTFIYETSTVDVYRNTVGGNTGFGGGAANLGQTLSAATTANSAALTQCVAPATALGCTNGAAAITTITPGLVQGLGTRVLQNTNSFFIDIRGGWRMGPLLIEGIGIWTPGDDAQHDSFKSTKLYKGVNVDNAYGGAWAEILTGGSVDYFTGTGTGMGENHGLGRYGRRSFGTRFTYSVTPAFDVNFKTHHAWTDTKVDIDAPAASAVAGSFAATPCAAWNGTIATSSGATVAATTAAGAAARNCLLSPYGDRTYMGTEIDAGITYRFAPGLTFDWVYGHLFAGGALDSSYFDNQGQFRPRQSAKDGDIISARVRYQF